MPSQNPASIQFVTGKGGVGKSTVAAALSHIGAARGDRVLAIDSLGVGGLRRVLERSDPEFSTEVECPIEILELTTVDSLTEYIGLTLRIPTTLLRPLARLVDFVAVAAPGVREILTVGKICHEARSGKWDHIVVDSPSTGHIVELLNAPQAIAMVAPTGPLASETSWMSEMLGRESTSVVLVSLPEVLSCSETAALAERIVAETAVSIGGLVLNREAPSLSALSVGQANELPSGSLRQTAALAVQRHQVGVDQRTELSKIGIPIVAAPDGIEPLPVVVEALSDTIFAKSTPIEGDVAEPERGLDGGS